jgi:hypothetical protein
MSDEDDNEDEGREEALPAPEEGANVILAAGAEPVTADGPVNIGRDTTINLPSGPQQRAGFRLEPGDARLLMSLYRHTYKRFVRKDGTPRAEGQPQENGGAA